MPRSSWGETFGEVVASAMIYRLVHHPEISPSRATATGFATRTAAQHLLATDRRRPVRSALRASLVTSAQQANGHQEQSERR
jgi:hypothetical protein